ncbi:MAG: hypoxanthine phosphoribosyltransferase [Planctomycetota bacterium]|jgi:hypoxanthine phosphoribosyltransferase
MSAASHPPFRVLFSHDEILRRCHELARAILDAHRDEPPTLVMVVEGARPFVRVLQRLLPAGLPIHEVRAKSYSGTTSTGQVELRGVESVPCKGRDVLLLEDIVDTGRTIAALREHFAGAGARSVRTAALLSKPSRRVVEAPVEFVGFVIPDEFVIGFGMDLDGRYRELQDIVVYEAAVESAHAGA